jgi:hypothetical protein
MVVAWEAIFAAHRVAQLYANSPIFLFPPPFPSCVFLVEKVAKPL